MLDLFGLPTKGLRIKIDVITTTGLTKSGWTKRDKLLFALIRLVGGGAGTNTAPGASGGGAYCEKWYRGDELNSTEDVTIGLVGANDTNGGDSSFSGLTAGGGIATGAGGTATGGDLNINGNDGVGNGGGATLFFNFGIGGGGSSGVFIAWNFIAGE